MSVRVSVDVATTATVSVQDYDYVIYRDCDTMSLRYNERDDNGRVTHTNAITFGSAEEMKKVGEMLVRLAESPT
jgi:hypothetical protein